MHVVRRRGGAEEVKTELRAAAFTEDTLSLFPRISPRANEFIWTLELPVDSRLECAQATSEGTSAAERDDDTAIAEAAKTEILSRNQAVCGVELETTVTHLDV